MSERQDTGESRLLSLRGHQTVDADGAIHPLFLMLQHDIAGIEEALATILVKPLPDVP